MNEKTLKEIFSDETFVTELFKLETPELAQKALKEKGVDMSVEEIRTLNKQLSKPDDNGELDMDQLDSVAGGVVMVPLYTIPKIIAESAPSIEKNQSW